MRLDSGAIFRPLPPSERLEQAIAKTEYTLYEVQRRPSQLKTQLMQLRKESPKMSWLAGIQTVTYAIPVQCSNQLS